MKTFLNSLLIITAAATIGLLPARAEDSVSTLAFSNPSRPGTIRLTLGRGAVRIRGSDTAGVTVKSSTPASPARPRQDNLRVISTVTNLVVSEKDNVITIDAAAQDLGRNSGDCEIEAPRATAIIIQNVGGGAIHGEGLSGDIEINSTRGSIELNDIAGSLVIGAMGGDIRVNVRELREGRPISITSMKGEVTLGLPDDTRASLRCRTHNGSVLTEFDAKTLVTKTDASSGPMRAEAKFSYKGADGKQMSASMSSSGEKNGGSSSSSNSNSSSDDDPTSRKKRTAKETSSATSTSTAPRAEETPELAVSAPTISGGTLVTGTLNGGGPEISIASLNGDIIIRKLGAAK